VGQSGSLLTQMDMGHLMGQWRESFVCMGFGKLQATWKLLHEPQVVSGQE